MRWVKVLALGMAIVWAAPSLADVIYGGSLHGGHGTTDTSATTECVAGEYLGGDTDGCLSVPTLTTNSAGLVVDDHLVDLDVTPGSGDATLEQSDDALQVKYDTGDFTEGSTGLVLAANPSMGVTGLSGILDLGTGTISGGVVVTVTGTGALVDATGNWVFVTAAVSMDLPAVSTAGQSVCLYATGDNLLTIDQDSSDVIVLYGTPGTGGVGIKSAGAAGDFVCLLSDGTSWYVLGISGAWTVV